MTALLSRGRIEALAAALDDVDPVTPRDPGTETGVAIATALRTAGEALAPAARPEFRDALRTRLMAVAAVQGIGETAAAAPAAEPVRAPAPSWRQGLVAKRGSAVLAGSLASVVGMSGVAVASSQSLPGDPFYGVKRTVESVQLSLADTDTERGERHLQFAETRLREAQALLLGRDALSAEAAPTTASVTAAADDEPPSARLIEVMADMDQETRTGSGLLTEAYRDSGDAEPLQALSRFADEQQTRLRSLLPALPTDTRSYAEQSLALVTAVTSQVVDLLSIGSCTAACNPSASAPALRPDGTVGPAPGSSCECPPADGSSPAGTAPVAPGTPTPTPAPGPSQPPGTGPAATQPPSSRPGTTPRPGGSTSTKLPLPLDVPTVPVLPGDVGVTVPPLLPQPEEEPRGLLDTLLGPVTGLLGMVTSFDDGADPRAAGR